MNAIRKAKLLLEAQQFVAQAMADQYDITVVRGGTMAATDGKVINLPHCMVPRAVDDIATLDRLLTYERGYVDHEVGHCRFTQFTEVRACGTALVHSLLNGIEDSRIENAMGNDYPVCDRNMRALSVILVDEKRDNPVDASTPPGLALSGYVCHFLRFHDRQEACYEPHVKQGEAVLRELFGDTLVDELHALLRTARNLTCTRECRELAEAIIAMLKLQLQQMQQQTPQQQASAPASCSSGTGNGQPGDAGGQAGGDSSETGDSPAEGASAGSTDPNDACAGQPGGNASSGAGAASDPGEQASPTSSGTDPGTASGAGSQQGSGTDAQPPQAGAGTGSGTKAGKRKKGGSKGQASQPAQDASPDDGAPADSSVPPGRTKAENIEAALASPDPNELAKDRSEVVAAVLQVVSNAIQSTGKFDVVYDSEPYRPGGSDDVADHEIEPDCFDVGAIRVASAQLRNRMLRTLEGITREKTWRHNRGSRLDTRALTNLNLDGRVFLHQQDRKAIDTSVFVLCDVSGSMGDATFDNKGGRIEVAREAMLAATLALELVPGVDVAVGVFPGRQLLLRFGQRVASKLPSFGIRPRGGTPLASGLDMAWRAFRGTTKTRRICIVLTDGQPDCPVSARGMINAMQWSGIDMVGVGIQCNHVEKLFPNHLVIKSLADLPPRLMSVLHSKLVQQVRPSAA